MYQDCAFFGAPFASNYTPANIAKVTAIDQIHGLYPFQIAQREAQDERERVAEVRRLREVERLKRWGRVWGAHHHRAILPNAHAHPQLRHARVSLVVKVCITGESRNILTAYDIERVLGSRIPLATSCPALVLDIRMPKPLGPAPKSFHFF